MPRTQIKKSVLIATRITPYTNDRVKEAVEKSGMNSSEWLRMLIFFELKKPKLELKKTGDT